MSSILRTLTPLPPSSSVTEHKYFRLFWYARVATSLAFQMLGVAVGWQMYELTGSALYLGLVGLAQFLPMLLLALMSGYVADRYDRRVIASLCQLLEGLIAGMLAIACFQGRQNSNCILVAMVVVGAARSFESPAMQSLFPKLVAASYLSRATALVASALQTATIIGPALGGFLYAVSPTIVYAFAGLLFMAASSCIILIGIDCKASKHKQTLTDSVFAGLSFIRSRKDILGAISLDLFAVLFGGATALLPIYAKDILMTGPWGLGLLRSAPAVGALGMSVFMAHFPLRRRVGRTMLIAVAMFGFSTIIFAVTTSFILSLASLVILGAADVVSVVIRHTLVQMRTPDQLRGRVSAVNSIFIGTSNYLGEFESGVTAFIFGAVNSVLIGGIGTVLVVMLWIRLFPSLVTIDSLD